MTDAREDLAPVSKMTIRQIVAAWRSGCSCADEGKPWQCGECTDGMIRAIDRRARRLEERADFLRRGIENFLECPLVSTSDIRARARRHLSWLLEEDARP